MWTDTISVGNRVDLKAAIRPMAEQQSTKPVRVYKSQFLDILDDGKLKLSMPIEGGKVLLLPIGGNFEMFFYTEKGIFRCIGKISDRYKEGNIYLLVVEILTHLEKFQRREYFRLLCTLDTCYYKLSESKKDMESKRKIVAYQSDEPILEDESGEKIKCSKGTIVDISGGGVRIVSEERLEKATYIRFKYNIKRNYTIFEFDLVGLVLSSEGIMNKIGQYEHRIKYHNIKREDREAIVKYIFDEERKIRKMK